MGGNIIIGNMRLTGNAIKKATDYRIIIGTSQWKILFYTEQYQLCLPGATTE
jgi:hypothetical protein